MPAALPDLRDLMAFMMTFLVVGWASVNVDVFGRWMLNKKLCRSFIRIKRKDEEADKQETVIDQLVHGTGIGKK